MDFSTTRLFHRPFCPQILLQSLFYRARYYSPLLGRFISQDPLGFAGSGPNLYAYALDGPTDLVDPFGLESGATFNSQWKIDVCGSETKPCPMKGGPDFRSPDYYSFTVTGPWVGANVQLDANNNWYVTPVFAPPGAGWKIGASFTAGWIDPADGTGGFFLNGRYTTPRERHDFIHGWGAQGCAGYIIGGCRTWSKGSGWANEVGIMTPQAGVSGGYTLDQQDLRDFKRIPVPDLIGH